VTGEAASGPRIAIVADDLIWATRLADGVRAAGGVPVRARSAPALDAVISGLGGGVVDLTSRAYDGLAAVAALAAAGVPVIAVGQHDDVTLWRSAREAGAARVYAYRVLFERGDRELGAWVGSLPAAVRSPAPADEAAASPAPGDKAAASPAPEVAAAARLPER
jgi:hypothetical protein